MKNKELDKFLKIEWLDLKESIKDAVRTHVISLKSQYPDLYGYALMLDEHIEMESIVAVYNKTSNIKENTVYYKFSVDEWENWDHDALQSINKLLLLYNEKFNSIHIKENDHIYLDEYQIKYQNKVHNTVMLALKDLNKEELFNFDTNEKFIAIWISDADNEIMKNSVLELNSNDVIKQFKSEFH